MGGGGGGGKLCHSSPSGIAQISYKFDPGFYDDSNTFACNGNFLGNMLGEC